MNWRNFVRGATVASTPTDSINDPVSGEQKDETNYQTNDHVNENTNQHTSKKDVPSLVPNGTATVNGTDTTKVDVHGIATEKTEKGQAQEKATVERGKNRRKNRKTKQKQKRRREQLRTERPHTVRVAKKSESDVRDAIAEYLRRFADARDKWKFSSATQRKLIASLFDFDVIPKDLTTVVARYVASMNGNSRERALDVAQSIQVDPDDIDAKERLDCILEFTMSGSTPDL